MLGGERADPRCGLRTRPCCALTVHRGPQGAGDCSLLPPPQGPRPTPTAEQPPSVALRVRGTAGLGEAPTGLTSGGCSAGFCVWPPDGAATPGQSCLFAVCGADADRTGCPGNASVHRPLTCRHTFSPPALGPFPCLSSDRSRPGLCEQRKHSRFPRTKEGGEKG